MTDVGPAPPAASVTPARFWQIPQPAWPVRILFVAVAITGILLVLAAWRLPPFGSGSQRTEDAYVQGHTTVIAPQVAGYVWRVHVDDFAVVRAGQILAEIDPRPFQQRVEQARANLDAKLAELKNNRQRLAEGLSQVRVQEATIASAVAKQVQAVRYAQRSADLVKQGALSQRERESDEATLAGSDAAVAQAKAARDSAIEQVKAVRVNEAALVADAEAARAQLHQAAIDLGYTTLRAPQDGSLSEVVVRIGQFAAAGTPFMYLVPAQRWVIANFKEAQTRHMAVGQPAWFAVDALGGLRFRGHIERIAPATGAQFSALKPDNATGNFTKVPQRIPVRIAIDAGQPQAARLGPGMSVEAHVDIFSGSRAGRAI
ncbi:HlyD family secretion protein [Sphingomonas nostoxanthinifaciens]|uniref:HlyD family secretion protein n=1 Tax=Sphingomonas nostoxanthinifaciens TaxID=2872652 RepID=UPI001CC1E47A|nr:HlyD family secretion protein [Sphingomonas nostoxanthinifaciens]UAK26277.1 HlyD family secretion protein [Sphingomonas nostoxanthinifaciens]